MGRTNRLLYFETTRPAILLCYVCIRCRGDVSTEPLSGNYMGIHIRLIVLGEIYEVQRCDWFRCHGILTMILTDWFQH